ncbi:hypothetical protein VPH35_053879 [Triticum aestivum]
MVPMEDCSCGCLAMMVPMVDACVYESGVELTHSRCREQLASLLTTNRGFLAPYVCRLTARDLEESWKMTSRIGIVAPSSGVLNMETAHKNNYKLMEVAYHIDFDGRINLTIGWKEFVAESRIEKGDVVMVMFFREMAL